MGFLLKRTLLQRYRVFTFLGGCKRCHFSFFIIFFLTNWVLQLDKCRKLIKYAKKSLDNGTPYYGIEACNEVLNGYSHIIGSALKHECLCTRAALLIKVIIIIIIIIMGLSILFSIQFSFFFFLSFLLDLTCF